MYAQIVLVIHVAQGLFSCSSLVHICIHATPLTFYVPENYQVIPSLNSVASADAEVDCDQQAVLLLLSIVQLDYQNWKSGIAALTISRIEYV